jgi:rhodanese-related sulfurtransferase
MAGLLMAGLAILSLAACADDDATDPTTASAVLSGDPPVAVADQIDPQEGQAMMASAGDELTVIDVRTPDEYANGHVDGAINIDVQGGGFSAAIAALDPAQPYIVYCQSGRRSAIAAATMVAAGFTQVHDMGGLQAWIDAGLPIVAA